MSTALKQMSTFAFLVDAIRRSTTEHRGAWPISLSLGPVALCMLRASPELRHLPWEPTPRTTLHHVPILEARHGEPPRIRHADGREEEL